MASHKIMVMASHTKPFYNLPMLIRVVVGNTVINISTSAAEYF